MTLLEALDAVRIRKGMGAFKKGELPIVCVDGTFRTVPEKETTLNLKDMLADEWHLRVMAHNFTWALEMIAEGKKVRHQSWGAGGYVNKSGDGAGLISITQVLDDYGWELYFEMPKTNNDGGRVS